MLTTGRHRDHYLSGNQARRIAALNERAPEPVLQVHPDTAAALGLVSGRRARVTSRQGESVLDWEPNPDLRPDTLFVPYHWPGVNALTSAATDPVSGIAAVKHTPVRVEPVRPAGQDGSATRTIPSMTSAW